MILLLLSFLISCALVAFMLPHILILSLRKRLVDPINTRKVHTVAASRLGGVSFFPAILFSVWFCVAFMNVFVPFVTETVSMNVCINIKMILETLALLTLFMIGIYDDLVGASYKSKFFVQIFAALLIIATGTYIKTFHGFLGIEAVPYYIGVPITLFLYVFVTNAINLIDGIDGLASLLSIMAFTVYSILLFKAGMINDSLITIASLGALIPFCYSNVFGFKPRNSSKIFMGDTGALVIGAVLGFSAISIWNTPFTNLSLDNNQLYYTLAYTMLIIPCFDVARIILHRFREGNPLFMPDRNHIHHKFMALGYTPRMSLLCIVAMNMGFIVLNIILSYLTNFTVVIVIDIIAWTSAHLLISKKIAALNK